MITRNLAQFTYPAGAWMTRGGKAAYQAETDLLLAGGGFVPRGATRADVPAQGQLQVRPRKPSLMMDPSDPTTWQRRYLFTGGQIGGVGLGPAA